MGLSKDGKTVGITLRLKKGVLDVYASMAHRKNASDLQRGGRGLSSAQDVMRYTLESNPEVVAELAKSTPHNT